MRTEHEFAWELLQDEIPDSFDTIATSIKNMLLDFKSTIDECVDAPTFAQSIHLRILGMKYTLKLAQEKLEREVKTVRRNATGDNPNSYILQQMAPVYRLASQQSGKDYKKRQISIVQDPIKNGTLFPNLCITINQHMEELIKSTFTDLCTQIQEIFDLIRSDLTMACSQVVPASGDDHKELKEELDGFESELTELLGDLPPAPQEDGRNSTAG